MYWGNLVLDRMMGPAAGVLIDEYERRCGQFGPNSYQVTSLVATELGFEHNLGLLHKAHRLGARAPIRKGVLEQEYYLERCLLEAEGAAFIERGMAMCASVVGDEVVERKYREVFGKEGFVPVPPHLQVPELRLHPASEVGAVEVSEVVQSVGKDELQQVAGFCYLSLLRPEYIEDARLGLGPNPRFVDLLEFCGAHGFLPDVELAQLSMRQTSVGYHVDRSGEGVPFLGVLDAVRERPDAQEWKVGGQGYLSSFGIGADSSDILCDWLSRSLGRNVRLSEKSLSLVTNSAALLGHEQKKQLRSLEALGDSVLSMMIARDNYLRGEPVDRYQNLRSNITSNKVLTDKFMIHVPPGAVAFLPNVNPAAGVTGAKALESILGAVWLDLGDDSLAMMLMVMEFLDFPLQVVAGPLMIQGRVGGVDDDGEGYCYLALFKSQERDKLRVDLGPWPDLRVLLRVHFESYDYSALRRLGFDRVSLGWHVGEGLPGTVEGLFRSACLVSQDRDAGSSSLRSFFDSTVGHGEGDVVRVDDKVGGARVWKYMCGLDGVDIVVDAQLEGVCSEATQCDIKTMLVGAPSRFDCMLFGTGGTCMVSASQAGAEQDKRELFDLLTWCGLKYYTCEHEELQG